MNDRALATLAETEQMIPNAPVTASRSVTINAPVDRVWRILTNVKDWPRWHPYLKNAELDGDFAAGYRGSYLRHVISFARTGAGCSQLSASLARDVCLTEHHC